MDKSILVTGCSSGIGFHAIHVLKARGYGVIATARQLKDVERLRQSGFEAFQLDLNSSHSIQEAVKQILSLTDGKMAALFNNAGYAQPGALEDVTRDILREQFETNVFGLQELTNLIIPVMRKQGYGRIIHMSSVLGIISLPYRGAYNASKYAVEALGDTLRLELRNTNIKVSLIEAGPIASDFRENATKVFFEKIAMVKSVHRDNYERFVANFKRNRTAALGKTPNDVTKKLLHALESRNPKTRYYVTAPTYLFMFLKRVLPSKALDWILEKIADREIKS